MSICEQAETFRLLLRMGLASKSEIISWPDDLILSRDMVPEWVLDVSLAVNDDNERLESKLRDVPCDCDHIGLQVTSNAAMHRINACLGKSTGAWRILLRGAV